MASLLIFDFDGVIADSETIANAVLVDVLSEIGMNITPEESSSRYTGKRMLDVIADVEVSLGEALPGSFSGDVEVRTLDRMKRELQAVGGVERYIETVASVRKCIASSSLPGYLNVCLDILQLSTVFQPNVFSASLVRRGKPHPDIFLHAAGEMEISPSSTVVIEDSVSGVAAGVAAGMTVIGLLAGSHIQRDHAERLAAAGAHHLAHSFDEVEAITSRLLVA